MPIASPATAARRAKSATLGGDGSETPFEQSFATIARQHVEDRAPALLDYEVGFQLLDRDDRTQSAAGVFGFKVGPQWMFVPVFWLDGDVKGHELLYLRTKDQFVPLKENWIDSLLSRSPSGLGEPVDRDLSRRGLRQPDLAVLSRGPYKYASSSTRVDGLGSAVAWADGEKAALEEEAAAVAVAGLSPRQAAEFRAWAPWAQLGVPALLKAAAREDGPTALDVARLRPEALGGFLNYFHEHPGHRAKLAEFYGKRALYDALVENARRLELRRKRAEARERLAHTAKSAVAELLAESDRAKLAVYVRGADEPLEKLAARLPAGLSDDDRRTLLRSGVLVKDAREEGEVAHAFDLPSREKLAREILKNPGQTGLYRVLLAGGDTARCLVVLGAQGPNGGRGDALVVRLDDKKWSLVSPGDVWTASVEPPGAYESWREGLPAADELPDGRCVLLGPGSATLPVRRVGSLGSKAYEAEFECGYDCRDGRLAEPSHREGVRRTGPWPAHRSVVRLGEPGSRLRRLHGELLVPSSFRRLALEGYADLKPELGTAADVERAMRKAAEELPLRRHKDGRYEVAGVAAGGPREALAHLVVRVGLREKAARELLERADRAPGAVKVWLYKSADLYNGGGIYLTGPGPQMPDFPEPPMGSQPAITRSYPLQYDQQLAIPVADMRPKQDARSLYDPFASAQYDDLNAGPLATAMRASQSGRKELFDATAIGSISRMLRPSRDDTLIDDDLDVMTKALSAMGRQLFKLYRHKPVYEDRYGRDDIAEIEDALRTNFENFGDLILTMKQKTIESDPEEAARETDLEPAARS